MRTVTKLNTERDFFSFMSKRRKYADVLPVLAQNKSILHMACSVGHKKIEPIMYYEGILPNFLGVVAPTPSL